MAVKDRCGAGKVHLMPGKRLVKNGDGANHPTRLLGVLKDHKDAADEQGLARLNGPLARQPGIERHQTAPQRRIHEIHRTPLRLIHNNGLFQGHDNGRQPLPQQPSGGRLQAQGQHRDDVAQGIHQRRLIVALRLVFFVGQPHHAPVYPGNDQGDDGVPYQRRQTGEPGNDKQSHNGTHQVHEVLQINELGLGKIIQGPGALVPPA